MDQQALPIVLAWQLERFDAATGASAPAADFIVDKGPGTEQDRWENQEGYSPGTIAAEIAGLVCAADIARRNGATRAPRATSAVADRWAAQRPALDGDHQRPVLRRAVLPAADQGPQARQRHALQHRRRRAREGRPAPGRRPSFLELVRLGVKRFDDPVILNTLEVVDQPLGRAGALLAPLHLRRLRRAAATAASGGSSKTTRARRSGARGRSSPASAASTSCWRAARPTPQLEAMADAGNGGGMLPEQVWDGRAPTGKPASEGRGNLLGHPAGLDPRAARPPGLVDRGRNPGGAPESSPIAVLRQCG